MRVTLLYFAAARERAGCSRETLELAPGATAGTALLAACAAHPELSPISEQLRLAVDQEFAPLHALLREGAEVALIPPVSGGFDLPRTLPDAALPSRSGRGFAR